MINFRKAGLLIVTLVIPALIFVFLKLFATNHYDVTRYYPQHDANGKVMLNNKDTVFYRVPDISLKSIGGEPVTLRLGQGRIKVAGHLSEVCDEPCKVILSQLDRVFALREPIKNLDFVSFTEKWDTNTQKLSQGINADGWQVLVGSPEEVSQVSDGLLKLRTEIFGLKASYPESRLVLIDPQGVIRGYYDLTDSEETDRLMAEIKILDYEKKSN